MSPRLPSTRLPQQAAMMRAAARTPAGRYIVLLDDGIDTSATVERMGSQKGIKAERTFGKTIRGFSARLDAKQRKALEADPSVFAVVPDEVIQVAGQTTPTGVSRIFTKSNTIAKINGVDERVDADVAIVDTGIQPNHPDLNVVGGYNCSTSNRAAWRDVQSHGTHVAGNRRREGQHDRRRRRRAWRAPVGGQDPQRRRLRPALVVRVRPRLDPRPARPGRPLPAVDRGGEHERRQERRRRSRLRRCPRRTSCTWLSAAWSRAVSRSWPLRATTR